MKRIMAFAMAFMMIGIIISCPLNLIVFASDDSYKSWKQYDERWGDTPTGGTDTLRKTGCIVTAFAMLMVKSGAEPNDVNQFNPGIFCNRLRNDGMFDEFGNLKEIKQSYSPNFYYALNNKTEVLPDSYNTIYNKIQNWLNEGYYILVGVKWDSSKGENGHWVAVDYCADGEVYIMDPGYRDSYTLRGYDGGISGIKLIKANNIYGTQDNHSEEKTPSKPIVTVTSSDEWHPVIVSYNACSDATNYDIRFYNANTDELIYGIGCFQEALNFGTNVVYTDTSYSHSFQAGSYYVTVAAVNNKKTSNWWNYSDKVYFTVTDSSEYPEKPIVHVEASYSDKDTVITWQACQNIADPYYCHIYNSSTGEECYWSTEEYTYPTTEGTRVQASLAAGEYYVEVTACNHFYRTTATSDRVYFTVSDPPTIYPDKPSLKVNATDEAHPVAFSWASCANADWYDIRIYKSDDTNIVSQMEIKDLSFSYSLEAGNYYANVASVNVNGNYLFSDNISFTVSATPTIYPDKPTLKVNAADEAHPVTVSYNSCSNTTDYCVRFYDLSDQLVYAFGYCDDAKSFDNYCRFNELSYSNFLPVGDYYVTVTAVNADDSVWTVSDAVSFSVKVAQTRLYFEVGTENDDGSILVTVKVDSVHGYIGGLKVFYPNRYFTVETADESIYASIYPEKGIIGFAFGRSMIGNLSESFILKPIPGTSAGSYTLSGELLQYYENESDTVELEYITDPGTISTSGSDMDTTENATTTETTKTAPIILLEGDYNDDGSVTVADAVLLARFVAEDETLTDKQIDNILNAEPDQDKDNLVTILDVIAILKNLEYK